jgi:putative oxidoreductase
MPRGSRVSPVAGSLGEVRGVSGAPPAGSRRGIRSLLFGGAGGGSSTADLGLLLFRTFVGLTLAFGHGIGKLPPSARFLAGVEEMGFPLPVLFGWAAALSESMGGLLLALGLLTRPAALLVGITMAVAAFLGEAGNPFRERELALLFGTAAVMFLLAGAGRYSVDSWIGDHK